jgi:ribonuclease R
MPTNSKKSKKKNLSTRTTKEEKLFQNLLKTTEQFMTGKSFVPLPLEQLMDRLSLPIQHKEIFIEVLHQLADQNLVVMDKDKFSWKGSTDDVMTGILRVHPRGFGFVVADHPLLHPQDIFIPKHLTMNGVDGDHVEVKINQESYSEKGPEGKVITILSRGRTHLAGIVRAIERHGDIVVHAPLLGMQQRVTVETTKKNPLKVGDRIVMEVIDWGSKDTETHCRFSRLLGNIDDPSCDIHAAIEEFEIRKDFPAKVVEEAQSYGTRVPQHEINAREDLREITTITIDPDTAKDFDDALSLTKDSKGVYHLGVHIADVSYYVHSGSALDEEAAIRCNSTYFPGTCVPMLPGGLSENLCSLKPNVNRLTVSVFVRFNEQGDMLDYRIARTVIKSSKRFTYREAKKVIDGEKESPHAGTLATMVELCRLLKRKRYERGSIEFSLPELVVLVDEKGTPTGTDYVSYDITHQMVEEFMLKANELVAWHLTEIGKRLTYRVHDVPSEENLRDFSLLAAAFGFKLPDTPSTADLQALFETAGDSPYLNYLASSYIRRMRLAAYSADNIGHYGLSLTHYCHFTSPIRRYVDLVVHRILFGESDDLEYLQTVAQRCSDQERVSAKAEGSVLVLKKLRLLDRYHKEDPYQEYPAVITKVKNFGVYFEIINLLLEGFIHISELEEDYFVFDEQRLRLVGRRHGSIYAPGQKITVMLRDVNFVSQETQWYISEHVEQPAKSVDLRSRRGRERGYKKTGQPESHQKSETSRREKAASKKKPPIISKKAVTGKKKPAPISKKTTPISKKKPAKKQD